MAIKLYDLPLNHFDEKFTDFNFMVLILRKPSFIIDVMAIFSRSSSSLWVLILQFCHKPQNCKIKKVLCNFHPI